MSMTSDSVARVTPKQPELAMMHRVVGIIGGMGPEATLDLMRRVLAKTPAQDDQDHIHLIVESNPKIPSRIAHLIEGTGDDPTPELIRIAVNLQRAGAQALAIPCNTAHAYASLSTSNTPAASNSLRPLIVCCFHLGSSARAAEAHTTEAIAEAARRNRERDMGRTPG
jgi:hypothetical protein